MIGKGAAADVSHATNNRIAAWQQGELGAPASPLVHLEAR